MNKEQAWRKHVNTCKLEYCQESGFNHGWDALNLTTAWFDDNRGFWMMVMSFGVGILIGFILA